MKVIVTSFLKITLYCLVLLIITTTEASVQNNISCYQCERNAEVECDEMDLRPCNSVSDRCVVQMTKNAENGEFKLKRECGLGPCTFEDDMANKGLGWVNKCDRSKNSYFCLWCCKGNGCNKNAVSTAFASKSLIVTMLVIILLALIKGFQPPYAPENHVIK